MRTAAFALALTLPLAALAQQPERFEFKGIALGTAQAQFVERFPLIRCQKSGDTLLADTLCRATREEACSFAPPTLNSCGEQLAKDYSFGGVEVHMISAAFYDDALTSISLRFDSSAFQTLLGALEAGYGKPTKVEKEALQTRAGAVYENTTATWRRGDSFLMATRYTSNIDTSSVRIALYSAITEFARRRKEGAKKGAKDL